MARITKKKIKRARSATRERSTKKKKKKKTNAEGTPATSRLVIRGRRTDGDRFCLHIVYPSTISILHARVQRKPPSKKAQHERTVHSCLLHTMLIVEPAYAPYRKKKKGKKRGVQKDGRRSSTLTSPQVTQRLFSLCDSRGGNILNTGVNHVFMCEPALNTSRINRNIGRRL